MIIECPGCHYHYDVAKYRSRERLRCRCGQIVVVPGTGVAAREVKILYCSNCGGTLEKGNSQCPYCGSLVDLTSVRLNAYCPHCLAHSPEGARYCGGCSRPLISLLEEPEKDTHLCPRCRIQMRKRTIAGHALLECPSCCGLFAGADQFGALLEEQTHRTLLAGRGEPEGARLEEREITYLPCPFCEQLMNRVNYDCVSGVIIDYCASHGYWFDAGEIEKIAKWVATGGAVRQYAATSDDKRFGPSPAAPAPVFESSGDMASDFDRDSQRQRFEGASLFDIVILTILGK